LSCADATPAAAKLSAVVSSNDAIDLVFMQLSFFDSSLAY
jgi:hypothetical protein